MRMKAAYVLYVTGQRQSRGHPVEARWKVEESKSSAANRASIFSVALKYEP